jgi:hypothetical protein
MNHDNLLSRLRRGDCAFSIGHFQGALRGQSNKSVSSNRESIMSAKYFGSCKDVTQKSSYSFCSTGIS